MVSVQCFWMCSFFLRKEKWKKKNLHFPIFPSSDLAELFSFLQVIKPESNDKETEGAYESDLPEELCGSHLLQQSLKGYNDRPDVIIEAQFDDSDSEDGHGNTQNALIDGVKKLSVCVHEKGEYRTALRRFILVDCFKYWNSLCAAELITQYRWYLSNF